MSTALNSIDGDRGESLNDAVARRLRGKIAELRLSASEIARAIGMTQAAMSRRTLGKTEFTLNELDSICQATGIDFEYLVTGKQNPRQGGPDGGGVVRPKGFEPLTS
ncbi:helix-turn-helix domain-containing protein [Rhodococcus opacus]|uniref:Putative Xre family DNA-binding protein n=1 Tax=Rhodococcus opacus (strain B4) TaxID=632772 RepID=C1B999_RHOOB|nr:helix-turn-helix transcriptional regulator [Rhodococcus opacus]BAH52252.1 putative Xre family DNA-binding protein [Rhodococcus opacus B4]